MKKRITLLLIAGLFLMNTLAAKGGVAPCLATCCFGPRVGIEMNDGGQVATLEWVSLVVDRIILGVPVVDFVIACQAGMGKGMNETDSGKKIEAPAPEKKGGCTPFVASCCLGNRIGFELNDGRQVRNIEWMAMVVPIIPVLYMMKEAYDGKTMSEIALKERLDT